MPRIYNGPRLYAGLSFRRKDRDGVVTVRFSYRPISSVATGTMHVFLRRVTGERKHRAAVPKLIAASGTGNTVKHRLVTV